MFGTKLFTFSHAVIIYYLLYMEKRVLSMRMFLFFFKKAVNDSRKLLTYRSFSYIQTMQNGDPLSDRPPLHVLRNANQDSAYSAI